MGRLVLIARLAARDLRHRPAQAVLLLPASWLAAAAVGTVIAVAALTAIPALPCGRRPAAPILASEAA